MRILYVEDDPRDADVTERILRRTAPHLQVEAVSTIEGAIARLGRLASEPLDLVLTDVHLRDGDGLSLLQHIRESGLPVAVVLITGMGDEETAVAALKARADDYVVKRKDYLDRLPAILESALNHYRADASRRAHPLNVLYAEGESGEIEKMRRHFATHADHIHLEVVATATEAIVALQQSDANLRYDVFLVDIHTNDLKAFEALRALQRTNQLGTPIVLICRQEDELLARQGLKFGTTSFLVKTPGFLYQLPWELEEAHSRAELQRREVALEEALAEVQQLKERLSNENIYLQEEIKVASNFGEIIGRSQALQRVLRQTEQVASVDSTVLILGETGTGKELLAHAIHNLSPRHKHPLVKVNCAALPAPLIESELFGHEKGAFTGADVKRPGRFEIANGGSLFLDEVGELPVDLQSKLLRVLEEGEFERVGSSHTTKVDVRLIAATNRNLAEAVAKGTFRSDLYYRLSIFPIIMPPLRERREDIPILVTHFIKELGLKYGKAIETVPLKTMTVLQNYPWPGNVRELRNVIERAVIITQGSGLRLIESLDSLSLEADPPPADRKSDSQRDLNTENETLEQSEYRLILRTLKKTHWRVEGPGGAAELLDIHASTLRSRMKKLGIARPKVRAVEG